MTTTNQLIKLSNVRLVYPSLFEPKVWESKDGIEPMPKFEATFILDKAAHAKEVNEINLRIDEILTPHKTNRAKLMQKGYKYIALKDSEVLDNPLDAYENSYVLKATSIPQKPPVLLDQDAKTRVTDKNKFYSGCYVTAYIELRVTTKHDMYVGANIMGVQFIRDGEQIGGTVFNPEGMFEPVESPVTEMNEMDIPF